MSAFARADGVGRGLLCLVALVALSAAAACAAEVTAPEDVTTVEITDRVLVADTMRLGINTSGDNYYSGAVTKVRAAENFEGVRYRMISWGPDQDGNGIAVWFSPPKEAWEAMKGKVRYTLLGGPAKGETGIIKDISTKKIRDGRELTYIVFEKPVPPSNSKKNGILLEYENPRQGCIRENRNKEFWNTEQNTAHIGDVPPGSFGCAALWLRGSEKPAHYTFVPMWSSQAPQNGTWRVQLWAKGKAGEPTLTVAVEGAESPVIKPDGQWREHDLSIEVTDFPEDKDGIAIRLVASGGEVLVDDVVIWKEEEHKNPTAFRDPLVDVIKRLRPGILRHLQMGGSNLENNIAPRLEQMGWSRNFRDLVSGGRNNAKTYKFNLHDYYELCEYVGAEPWYCLPGTLHPDEVNILMEYLAAPADVGYGKRRAELGHPKPWTETFDHIYIEFGNEAWNPGGYATGSFNGPDHWKDMIEVGRSSPHFKPNMVFVAGSQSASPGVTAQILRDVPNADLYAIAPYMMNGIRSDQVAMLDTPDKLYRWIYAYAIRRVLEPAGSVYRQFGTVNEAGKQLAIYEHNFHLTNPMPNQPNAVPLEWRNAFFTSIGGGINIINDALLMARERQIRAQCQFNLNQHGFQQGIRLWGFVPGLNYRDQRYRPTFLAQETANKVIGGDLVTTVHTGANPTFSATGFFEETRREKQVTTYENIPALWSYAFKEGTRCGLVLFNLDTQKAQTVELKFAGPVAGGKAVAWRLAADSIAANNEREAPEPQVTIHEETLEGFVSGRTVALPPFSMLGIEWRME